MDISVLYQYFEACTSVTTDSRNCPAGSLFFALKGENFNGNAFARKAIESGCRYAVIDEAEYADESCPQLLYVENCLEALQKLANYHRRKLGTPVIGITGTNGKTTTKELIAAVLQQKYNVLYTQGNFNNHIGVPLTLLQLKPEHELAVVEMGANHPGEIDTLVHIAEPDFGIITDVGRAHLEGFGSFEGVIRTKGELYDYLRGKEGSKIFLQNENPYLNRIASGLDCIRYGAEDGLFVSGKVTGCSPYLSFTWKHADGPQHAVDTHLIGAYNIDNALAAAAIGTYFKVDEEAICHALATYIPQNNRSQLKDTGHNLLIVDAYNANPTSMMAALTNFAAMKAEKKMVVLGDMKELGTASREEHQRIADFLQLAAFDEVFLVGTEFAAVNHPFQVFATVSDAVAYFQQHRPEGYHILIKGSNSMKLSVLPDSL